MLSRRHLFVGLAICALALVALFGASTEIQNAQAQQRRQPVVAPVQPEDLVLTLVTDSPTNTVTICENETARVKLTANATSSKGLKASYRWVVSGGQIEDRGAEAFWDLSTLKTGVYTATVYAETGVPGDICQAFKSIPIAVNECQTREICPNLVIYCPPIIDRAGQDVTFSLEMTDTPASIKPTLTWKVEEGTLQTGADASTPVYDWRNADERIRTGQGELSISVSTQGLEGKVVRATVNVGGFNQVCEKVCTLSIPATGGGIVEKYHNITYNHEKANLDNFVIWLQNNPGARGYIFAYQGRRTRAGHARLRANRARDYIVNERGIEASRIIVMEGGRREEFTMEVHGVPLGATAPQPTP